MFLQRSACSHTDVVEVAVTTVLLHHSMVAWRPAPMGRWVEGGGRNQFRKIILSYLELFVDKRWNRYHRCLFSLTDEFKLFNMVNKTIHLNMDTKPTDAWRHTLTHKCFHAMMNRLKTHMDTKPTDAWRHTLTRKCFHAMMNRLKTHTNQAMSLSPKIHKTQSTNQPAHKNTGMITHCWCRIYPFKTYHKCKHGTTGLDISCLISLAVAKSNMNQSRSIWISRDNPLPFSYSSDTVIYSPIGSF